MRILIALIMVSSLLTGCAVFNPNQKPTKITMATFYPEGKLKSFGSYEGYPLIFPPMMALDDDTSHTKILTGGDQETARAGWMSLLTGIIGFFTGRMI